MEYFEGGGWEQQERGFNRQKWNNLIPVSVLKVFFWSYLMKLSYMLLFNMVNAAVRLEREGASIIEDLILNCIVN